MLETAKPGLGCFLPNHFLRIRVFSQSEKDWLTQTIVPRPLGEFDSTDDHRSDPATTLHFGGSQSLVPAAPATCREIKKGTFPNPNIYPPPPLDAEHQNQSSYVDPQIKKQASLEPY